MKAIECQSYAPPEDLVLVEKPAPQPKDGEVLIRVGAAGAGFVDGLLVQGLYQVKMPLPFIPGNELAGEVLSVGDNVTSLRPGDRVVATSMGGAFAEQIALPAAVCIRIPDTLGFNEAAGLIISYCTALYGLKTCGRMESGETVLVLGGAGGVGSSTIRLAKAMGARVIAAASSQAKRDACREMGADATVDYTKENWRDELKVLIAETGLDIVFDPVGGDFSEPALRSLSPGGRFLVVGFAAGEIPKIALNLALLKRCHISGVDWGGFARADVNNALPYIEELISMTTAGELKPEGIVAYPLAEAGQALRDMLDRKAIGKVVLNP